MHDTPTGLLRNFLIVTPNVVVAEDLKEILAEFGGGVVEVFASMASTWKGTYDAAFFAIPVGDLLHERRIRDMHDAGTRVVVLDGGLPESAYYGTGLFTLPHPFRTEDVIAVLEKIGITKPDG
ncbi:hypothetical protein [Ovoidimarina sediminis]|uniref:hypothetical protein n=1 Tax=Ovoidimarina sediminis TaxID=3079856 RepID=UPI0029082915|nr:hypothetical protein [Rhodophyticola sp. MJ-SS7]MDU8944645.1 hypothetical protein [Rhodophyticola sp. MJ-SS7]